MTLNSIYVDNLIKTALLEDINYLDTTTDYLIDENQENTAIFLAKSSGVLCGIEVALRVFEILQPNGFEANLSPLQLSRTAPSPRTASLIRKRSLP